MTVMSDETYRHTPESVRRLRERVEILAGLHNALERWPEVAALAFASASPKSLKAELSDLLGIGEVPAQAVLDMQFRRVSKVERDRMRAEFKESQADLDRAMEQLGD